MSLSLPPCLPLPLPPCPSLSLPGWGRGAQCSGSRCRLTQAAGSEAEEGKEPAAPGHTATLQETWGTHRNTQCHAWREGLLGALTGTYTYKSPHTATPKTRMDARHRYPRATHTDTKAHTQVLIQTHTDIQSRRHTQGVPPRENPEPWTRTRTHTHPSGAYRHIQRHRLTVAVTLKHSGLRRQMSTDRHRPSRTSGDRHKGTAGPPRDPLRGTPRHG